MDTTLREKLRLVMFEGGDDVELQINQRLKKRVSNLKDVGEQENDGYNRIAAH